MKSSETGGIGFLSVLFFIFLVLKLTGYIAWSWWWVTSPLWIPVAIVIIVALVYWSYRMVRKW